jgi:hypothetical protein
MKSHGMYKTPTYNTWEHMLARCRNPNNKRWKRYGGRGITVCERWLTFENFLADMGEKPPGLTIERKDNDGNYEPGNCKWATTTDQNRNSSRAKLTMESAREIRALVGNGMRRSAAALQFGVAKSTIDDVVAGNLWREETERAA